MSTETQAPDLTPTDECRRCGKAWSAHKEAGILGRMCPNSSYERYAGKFWRGKLDLEYTDEPVCPYCGEQKSVADAEDWSLLDNDNIHSRTCGDCEREYDVETHVSYSFTTSKPDGDCDV